MEVKVQWICSIYSWIKSYNSVAGIDEQVSVVAAVVARAGVLTSCESPALYVAVYGDIKISNSGDIGSEERSMEVN